MKIEINNYCKSIHKETILDQINASFESGNIYGFFGENGSGKTMLLKAIAGLLIPTHGSVTIDGEQLGKQYDFPKSIGAIIENPAFVDSYTGYQNLLMLARINKNIGKDEVKNAIQRVGLNADSKKVVRKFSLGMKKRLAIAQAIMEKPSLLLLDEPTNALDDKGIQMFLELMLEEKKRGAIIIIASHNQSDILQIADKTYIIDQGRIISEGSSV